MAVVPNLAKYYPEEILSGDLCGLVANTKFPVSNLARFAAVPGDVICTLTAFSTLVNATTDFSVDADGTSYINHDVGTGGNLIKEVQSWISAKSSLSLGLLSTANIANYPIRYTVSVDKPTVIQKLLMGIKLTAYDIKIRDKFGLIDIVKSGEIPVHKQELIRSSVVSDRITAAGIGTENVGGTITVTKNRFFVIDRLIVDGHTGVLTNWLRINRDNDNNYINANFQSLAPYTTDAGLGYDMPWENRLFVPAIDKLEVGIYHTAGIVNLRVLYRYSEYYLTLREKIRWDMLLSTDEKLLADETDLVDKVNAGLV